jgi:IclR family transcriptional regulator, KDG regulon repressor
LRQRPDGDFISSGQRGRGKETAGPNEAPDRIPAGGGYSVRSLARALSILKSFDADRPSWSLAELSRRTGLHKATCFRLVKTLESEGFLAADVETGEYRLGPALLPLAYLSHTNDELVRRARPALERLSEQTCETVDLAIWTGEGALFIAQVLTSHPFKPEARVGRLFSEVTSAAVKVLLVFALDASERMLWLQEQAGLQGENLEARLADLTEVERRGVAFDLGERTPGITAVAAPVMDSAGRTIASLSVVAPEERFGQEERERHAGAVSQTAQAVSRELGYRAGLPGG